MNTIFLNAVLNKMACAVLKKLQNFRRVKILNKDVYFNVSILILFVYIFIAYIEQLLRFFRAVQTSRVHNSIYAR